MMKTVLFVLFSVLLIVAIAQAQEEFDTSFDYEESEFDTGLTMDFENTETLADKLDFEEDAYLADETTLDAPEMDTEIEMDFEGEDVAEMDFDSTYDTSMDMTMDMPVESFDEEEFSDLEDETTVLEDKQEEEVIWDPNVQGKNKITAEDLKHMTKERAAELLKEELVNLEKMSKMLRESDKKVDEAFDRVSKATEEQKEAGKKLIEAAKMRSYASSDVTRYKKERDAKVNKEKKAKRAQDE